MLRRAYELALCLYPGAVRERDGPEMLRLFDDMVEGARRSGGRAAAVRTALRIVANVPWSVARAHGRALRKARPGSAVAILLDGIRTDFAVALRGFRKRPHFTLTAVLTLTLGIGGTTAMFSVVWGTLFRPPPFPEPDRIVVVHLTRPPGGRASTPFRWSWSEAQAFAEAADFAEEVATFVRAGFNLVGEGQGGGNGGGAVHVQGEVASAGYFRALGVEPALGGLPGADGDGRVGPGVLLGHGLWTRRYGADPSVVGRRIEVNRVPLTVAGVLPPGFAGLSGTADLWIGPQAASETYYADFFTGHQHFLTLVARLRPGVSAEEAGERAEVVGAAVAEANGHPAGTAGHLRRLAGARIDPGNQRAQLLLFGAVLAVLLVGCTNLANILTARTVARRRELGTRIALGSTRGRLVRQLLVEGVVLAAAGGLLGLFLSYVGADALGGFVPDIRRTPENNFGQLGPLADVHVDLGVLLFAAGVSVTAGVGLAILPSWWASRTEPGDILHQAGGDTAGDAPLPPGSVLVVGQIGLTLVLSVSAGLLAASYANLQGRDLGIDGEEVLAFGLQAGWPAYGPTEGPEFLERVLRSVGSVPGVEAASVAPCTPLTPCATRHLFTESSPSRERTEPPLVRRHYVGPEHFEVLGIPILEGRGLTDRDRVGSRRVTVVGRTAARRFWPGEDAVGKRVWFDEESVGVADSAYHVVGVVADVRYASADEPQGADFYTSYLQFSRPGTHVVVRSQLPAGSLAADLEAAVADVDPSVPISEVTPLARRVDRELERPRATARVLMGFAGVALVLAALGVYGVMAQLVVQRRKEVGIRMALGAGRAGVLRMILRRALALVAAGLALGLVGTVLLGGVLRSFVYGVGTTDPTVLAAAAGILAGVALVASWLPARSATLVQPVEVLGVEG